MQSNQAAPHPGAYPAQTHAQTFMRTPMAFAVLAAVTLLQGCGALAAGYAADVNRERRARATVSLADSPPALGDTLVVLLTDTTEVRGALTRLTADSLVIGDSAIARSAVRRVERPWVRKSVGTAALVGLLVTVAAFLVWFPNAKWS